MMKKIFFSLTVFILIGLGSFQFVYAQGGIDPVPTDPPLIDDKGDIITIAEDLATWVYRIFFVIAVLYILFAAFTYLTAKDDAAKVKKAQTSLKNAIIAIIVALISTGLSLLIKSFL